MFQFFYDLLHDKETFEKHISDIGAALAIGGVLVIGLIAVIAVIIKS